MHFLRWWEACHISKTFNRQDSSNKKDLHGGCAVLSANKMCYRAINKGEDITKLGRWAWTTYQGKAGTKLKVVSAYRPCIFSASSPNAVWHQHNAYFASVGRAFDNPRTAMLDDLFADLNRFQAKGHLLIVAMSHYY